MKSFKKFYNFYTNTLQTIRSGTVKKISYKTVTSFLMTAYA